MDQPGLADWLVVLFAFTPLVRQLIAGHRRMTAKLPADVMQRSLNNVRHLDLMDVVPQNLAGTLRR
jgi:hypothetical protein